MTSASERAAAMSSLKLALLAQQVRQQLDGGDLLAAEPVAVIGIGCRFPGGADSPAAYWDLLARGVDAVREIPPDRWDADAFYNPDPYAPGTMNTRWGGFLDAIDRFDAAFFGLSPREAVRMDPQQRLLLEVAFEALERAGLTREQLAGSRTGVFVAATLSDYSQRQYGSLSDIDAHTITGNVHCIIPNRLSYLLNLQGPSVAIDTACSSSLVAVHLACQSLRSRESNAAIAGGVNVVLAPEPAVALAKWGMLAPDGRCKTFDARADGFVRGEGCGVVVLKRLADAVAAGDPVLAVIRGSAVNQDGRSTAMTAPNGLAQQEVLRQALANAQVLPAQIGYVEAHGTGTALGDPIEVEALAEVLGQPVEGAPPVALASVKTNIGHLEAASGVAGLIKVVLSMQHEAIPPHLHFTALNPHISLDRTRFYIPTELRPWPAGQGRRLAGVSSFGFGGTNAHVVLEEAPQLPSTAARPAREAWLLPLSAQAPEALRANALAFADYLASAGASLHDLCHTAALRRTHYDQRLAVTGATREELAERLRLYARGERRPGVAEGRREPGERRRVAFVFSGQGPQWWAMGRELLAAEPVFREVLERCDALLRAHTGWSLLEELGRVEAESRLDQTEFAQPALFALQAGLAALWQAWGIAPDGVAGHSVGEVAAAYVAGVLSLEDAVRVIAHRGRLMQRATGRGQMASVELPPAEVAAAIGAYGERLAIAAVNAPATTVISGEPEAVAAAVEALQRAGASVRLLPVNYAFHSPQMEPFARELAGLLAGLTPRAGSIALASSVAGAVVPGTSLDAGYWGRNVREPVAFAAAVGALAERGCTVFVEVGPHPVLGGAMARTLAAAGVAGAVVTCSLRRGRPEGEALLAALGELYACGVAVPWERVLPPGGRCVELPTYQWQRRRHWYEAPAVMPAPRPRDPDAHPLLGRRLRSPAIQGVVFESGLSAARPAFVGDHRIGGAPLLPATAFFELAAAAYRAATGAASPGVTGVELLEALPLPEDGERTVQTHLLLDGDGAACTIYSLHGEDAWVLHATCRLERAPAAALPGELDPAAVQVRCAEEVEPARLYAELAARRVDFGPAHQGIERVWAGEGEALGLVVAPAALGGEAAAYAFHPALLDAALHPLNVLLPRDGADLYLPVALDALHTFAVPGERLWSHVRLRPGAPGADTLTADVAIYGADGSPVAELRGLRLRRTSRAALARALGQAGQAEAAGELLFETVWREAPLAEAPAPGGPWLIVADRSGVGAALARELERAGATCDLLDPEADLTGEAARVLLRASVHSGAIYLRALDTPPLAMCDDDPAAAQARGLGGALALVQALALERPAARLWLVSRGAQPVAGHALAPEQATLLGLGATVAHEHPELRCARVDLDPAAGPVEAARALARELAADDGEDQVAVRAGARYAARLQPSRGATGQAPAEPEPRRLAMATRGVLDDLALAPYERRAPGRGEIEIRVRATGLNFRDVLNALGLYPEEVNTFGEECSGEVVRVGAGVAALRPGDPVLAMGSGAFASYLTTNADLAIRKPDGMSFAEAATVPIAFLTAQYALLGLGRLQPGERVLIHAAAGGVGMAAVQLAQRAGAEVYATAGSPEKRALLTSLGVRQVFDSRSLDFAAGVLAATGGRGVDVILNSLSGEFIPRSLAALARGGRFLEIGKRGIWTPEQVAAARPDAAYFVVFLGDLSLGDPPSIQAMLRELLPRFAAGELAPLPQTLFPLADVVAAFRYMAQARHAGKVVVAQPAWGEGLWGAPAIRPDATYLITGGLGGLGLLVARRLAESGARTLALVGRSAPGAAAGEAVEAIRRLGAEVHTFAADVAREDDVRRVLDAIRHTLPPLRGVVHAAGVNDDGVLAQQGWPHFASVLGPKLAGALHLDRLTRGLDLDMFVLFSSAAAVLGAAGQGNYAAANAFLDALASARRGAGYPALSIAWGPWDSVGMTARLGRQDQERLRRQGLVPLTAEQGLAAFELALGAGRACLAALALDRAALGGASRPILADLGLAAPAAPALAATPAQPAESLIAGWARTAPARRRGALLSFIQGEAARVLGLPPGQPIAPRQPLSELGLDSLMAVELRNALGGALGQALPATLLFDHPTSEALADYLVEAVPALAGAPGAGGAIETPAAPSLAAELADLTDEEAEALLLAELGEPQRKE